MLDKESLGKRIEILSRVMQEIELAAALESEDDTKNKLSSALGQIRAARKWLITIQKEKGWI